MRAPMTGTAILIATVALAAGTWAAAQRPRGTAEGTPAAGGQATAKPEIFCEGLSAGQLCLHGSIEVLKLDAERQTKWREAGRRYNQGVDAATKEFLQEVKALLSPAEYARVERWFDKSVNAYLNQQLLGRSGSQ